MTQSNGQKAQAAIVGVEPAAAGPGITLEQEKAIVLLGTGRSVSEAARETGIGRATLYRWLKDDPAFIAAWNAWRREQGLTARARLLGVAAEAAESVREAVRKDGRLALALLKEMGLVRGEKEGSDDPQVVRKEKELERRKRDVKMAQRESDLDDEEMIEGWTADREGRKRG